MKRLCISASVILGTLTSSITFGDEQKAGKVNVCDLANALKLAVKEREGLTGLSLRISRSGKLLFQGAEGLYPGGKHKFEVNSPARIASMTKPITATAAAVLVDQGKIKFEDTIDKHLPAFSKIELTKGGKPDRIPTIAECLSHTAGFRSVTMSRLPKDSAAFTGDNAAVFAELLELGLATEPGTKFAYTKLGYDVVAAIIEEKTGKRFEDALRELLLDPLGMSQTGFRLSDALSDAEIKVKSKEIKYFNPAGGLLSTPDDLTKFYMLHLTGGKVAGKQFIDRKILEQMYRPQPAAPNYGIGFNVSNPDGDGVAQRIRHGGASGTIGWADRKTGIIFIGLSQNGSKIAKPVWSKLTQLVDESLQGAE